MDGLLNITFGGNGEGSGRNVQLCPDKIEPLVDLSLGEAVAWTVKVAVGRELGNVAKNS